MHSSAALAILAFANAALGARSRRPCKSVFPTSSSASVSGYPVSVSASSSASSSSSTTATSSSVSSSFSGSSASSSLVSSVISSSSTGDLSTSSLTSSSLTSSTVTISTTLSSVISSFDATVTSSSSVSDLTSSTATISSTSTSTLDSSSVATITSSTISDVTSSSATISTTSSFTESSSDSTVTSSATVSDTTSSSATVSTTSSDTVYPVPTPGVEQPTNTFTGTITPFASGTPVTLQNPSFEDSGTVKKQTKFVQHKRQSAAQLAASSQGWTIASCGSGTLSDCDFENYDAADGIWAFVGKNGGLLYQDDVNLAAGGTYAFTFYTKMVSTYAGATSSSTGNQMIQEVRLGNTDNEALTGSGYVSPGPSAVATSGGDWAMQTLTLMLSCQYVNFATQMLPDGTLNYRMFIHGYSGSGSQAPIGDYLWYADVIRVQQLQAPAGGAYAYMTNTCKVTPPTSTATPVNTYTVTQTSAATATPTSGTNIITNPSFETIAIVNSNDVNGYATKASGWTSTGCRGRNCQLHRGSATAPTCQDGQYCEYWLAATTYSRSVQVTIGATYYLSIWTYLSNAPTTKLGGSITQITFERTSAVPGSGGPVLTTTISAEQTTWIRSDIMLTVDLDFAMQLCGASATDTTATCQFTIATSYNGDWKVADNVGNYFDNVSMVQVA